ncbi:PREDICTED: tumor necrosis factor ligand superfamily member 6-like [Cyprinodon variegatus]|uniref:tumor necrosis factor ligand superfamily member 6-like n=1 Tax=Cyprinodon variegatus TaxID=28743 RepID=UPI000742B12B|nr:PREDICTED: tumor necrosis factor ligand superfamily member 6-like [Cyprinodon variegatus]
MSSDQRYPYPQVFLVDEGGGQRQPVAPPNLIPCWSFPPVHESMRSRSKSRSCLGVSPSLFMVLLMMFLLVFAALGFEAWQILNIQKQLKAPEKVEPKPIQEFGSPLKQIGLYKPETKVEEKKERPAAHVIGRIQKEPSKTLRWEPKTGQAFVSGGVSYRIQDGGLQVNESGVYEIYSRVELIFKDCGPASSFLHAVFLRREGLTSPQPLMEAHRSGFCPQHSAHSWTTENYLGAALQLKRLDIVYVNVSHPSFLSHSHYANFFGLYKI